MSPARSPSTTSAASATQAASCCGVTAAQIATTCSASARRSTTRPTATGFATTACVVCVCVCVCVCERERERERVCVCVFFRNTCFTLSHDLEVHSAGRCVGEDQGLSLLAGSRESQYWLFSCSESVLQFCVRVYACLHLCLRITDTLPRCSRSRPIAGICTSLAATTGPPAREAQLMLAT
jgi:hypothetical protein